MLRDALWCPAQGVAEARERTSAWLSEASAIGGAGEAHPKSSQVYKQQTTYTGGLSNVPVLESFAPEATLT